MCKLTHVHSRVSKHQRDMGDRSAPAHVYVSLLACKSARVHAWMCARLCPYTGRTRQCYLALGHFLAAPILDALYRPHGLYMFLSCLVIRFWDCFLIDFFEKPRS